MYSFQLITVADLRIASPIPGLPALTVEQLERHKPDAHWVLLRNHERVAYCSLWWQETPVYSGHSVGCIGHYNGLDQAAAQVLLNHACQQLQRQGCTMAIAPIDGNTWRRYRCLSQRGSEPIFFLELDNPDDWNHHFEVTGFTSLAEYSSAVNTDLSQQDIRITRSVERLQQIGVEVRSLHLNHFEQELERIYHLSLISFRNNFLYTPISQQEFVEQYTPIAPHIQPELVLMAEHQHQLVGFLFAIPDRLAAKRGESVRTVIIKTVAVMPGRLYAGLGNYLVAECQAIAHRLGYTRAIHALMHDANHSRNLSARYAHPIRKYTLYAKELGSL